MTAPRCSTRWQRDGSRWPSYAPPAPARNRLRLHVLADEPILAALPVDHPLAASGAVALKQIAAEDIVLFERRLAPDLYDAILNGFGAAGLVPRIVHHAPQKASAMMLAAGGAGITLVPASLGGVHAEVLTLLPVEGFGAGASIAIACRDGETGTIARRFIDVTRQVAAAHPL